MMSAPVPGDTGQPPAGHAELHGGWLYGSPVGGEETLLLPGGQTLYLLRPDLGLPR